MKSIREYIHDHSPFTSHSQNPFCFLSSLALPSSLNSKTLTMMCEFHDSSPVPTPSPSPSPPQLSSTPPQTQLQSQSLAQRMKEDTCYKCKKQGHWARDCPINSQPLNSVPIKTSDVPVVNCPCGAGPCNVLVSKTDKHPGWRFYTCPAKSPGGKCGFFKWCNEVRAPICRCNAGACSINTVAEGPNAGRQYYACRIPKGHGACSFFEWVDPRALAESQIVSNTGQGSGSKSNVSPLSMQKNNDVFDLASTDSVVERSLITEDMAQMQVEAPTMDESNIEASSHSSLESAYPISILSCEDEQSVRGDMVMQEVESSGPMTNKAVHVSHLMTQSEIRNLQKEFWKLISAATDTSTRDIHQTLSLEILGWCGWILSHPSRCLTNVLSRPFVCGIFPSLDPISMPKAMGSNVFLRSSSISVCESPSQRASGEEVHPLNVISESSSLESPPSTVPNNVILEAFRQVLLITLMSMDPVVDNDAMLELANAAFNVLDRLSIDHTSISKRVKEFLSCASRIKEIESSVGNDLSLRELMKQYDIKRVHFGNISQLHVEAQGTLLASNEKRQSLLEQASHVRNMLQSIELQLSSCEAENAELETHIAKISEQLLESQASMRAAEEALKCRQRKEAELSVAKAALEKAKNELNL